MNSIKKTIFILLQYCLPQRLLTNLAGRLAESRLVWFKNSLIRWFIKHYRVDLSVAERGRAEDYVHFNDFFTRRLKPGARPLPKEPDVIISPADGSISESGNIKDGILLQAKNRYYSLCSLIGSSADSSPFEKGKFVTIYLSPRDYHRVHMPFSGRLIKTIYIPGKLFSVNTVSAQTIPNLFTKNERLVCLFDTALGQMAVILIGAMIVAGINTVWSGKMMPNKGRPIQAIHPKNISLARGDELGSFSLGSTVILLFESKASIQWLNTLTPSQPMKMGEKLGILAQIKPDKEGNCCLR